MTLTDPEKATILFNRLDEIRIQNNTAWNSSSTKWIKNAHQRDISGRYSNRLMIGPPVATDTLTVGELQNLGIWGLYEMGNEDSRPIYENTYDVSVDVSLQPTANDAVDSNPQDAFDITMT